ncbi:MAG: hypothetical protein SPD56_07595, partial [Alloprevotella sp.]|nr:hypothetical protein [Alloprevotella sp.]
SPEQLCETQHRAYQINPTFLSFVFTTKKANFTQSRRETSARGLFFRTSRPHGAYGSFSCPYGSKNSPYSREKLSLLKRLFSTS